MKPIHVRRFTLSKQYSTFQNKYTKSFTVRNPPIKDILNICYSLDNEPACWLAQSEVTSAGEWWPFCLWLLFRSSLCESVVATVLSPTSSLKTFKLWKSLFIINCLATWLDPERHRFVCLGCFGTVVQPFQCMRPQYISVLHGGGLFCQHFNHVCALFAAAFAEERSVTSYCHSKCVSDILLTWGHKGFGERLFPLLKCFLQGPGKDIKWCVPASLMW